MSDTEFKNLPLDAIPDMLTVLFTSVSSDLVRI